MESDAFGWLRLRKETGDYWAGDRHYTSPSTESVNPPVDNQIKRWCFNGVPAGQLFDGKLATVNE